MRRRTPDPGVENAGRGTQAPSRGSRLPAAQPAQKGGGKVEGRKAPPTAARPPVCHLPPPEGPGSVLPARPTSRVPWPMVKLGDVCAKVTSGGTPSTKHPEYYGGEIPWLRTQEVNFSPIFATELSITAKGLENSAAKWIPANSVVVAMYGATAGRSAIAKIPLTTNQACCNLIFDGSKTDYRFVYYSLKFRYSELVGLAKGAAQTNLSAGMIKEFEIPLPPLPVQHRIADILSAYDDLIENNRRRIAILEETARLAYRKWFVEFQFPGHGRTPTTKGIPHGWERVHLGDCIATNQATYRPSDWPPEINYIDISAVKEGRILEKKRILSQEAPGRARRKAQTGDVIWSNVRPNLKSYALVVEPEPNDVFSTGFTILTPKRIPYSFLYCLVSTDEFVSYLDNMVTGSTYPAVRPCDFEQAELILPNRELLDDFHGLFAPFLCQCRNLERQNTALAAARDMLLPRLMKGNVERDNA